MNVKHGDFFGDLLGNKDRQKDFKYNRRCGRRGPGRGRRGKGRRRRGRPKVEPEIQRDWSTIIGSTQLILEEHELEVIRLLDLENKTQDEAGEIMGVSRATVWRYAQSARKKIARAITSAKNIQIQVIGQTRQRQ